MTPVWFQLANWSIDWSTYFWSPNRSRLLLARLEDHPEWQW